MAIRTFVITLSLFLTLAYAQFRKEQTDTFLKNSNQASESVLRDLPTASFISFSNSAEEILPSSFLSKSNLLMVHFWATWCGPCEAEFPGLVRLAIKNPSVKFLIVAVNDKIVEMKKFLKRFGRLPINIILALDNSSISSNDYGVIKVPETFLFDEHGHVVKKFVGPQEWDEKYYSDIL